MAGIAGAIKLARRSPEAAFLAGTLVLFPLPYYVIHVLERYRFPIEPYLLTLGVALFTGVSGVKRRGGDEAAARGE